MPVMQWTKTRFPSSALTFSAHAARTVLQMQCINNSKFRLCTEKLSGHGGQELPMKLQHSSKSGGAVATVWYSKEFLYRVWHDGTVCTVH